MKILLIFMCLLVVVLGFCYCFFKYRVNNLVDKHNLEASIDKEVKRFAKKGLPNSLVVGIYKNKKTYFRSYGVDNPNSSTIFQIASVSKLFTSALLVILCDEGVVDMHDTLEGLVGDKYKLSEEAKKVTLYQLATHTAGFPMLPNELMDIIEKKENEDNIFDDPYRYINKEDVFSYLIKTEGKCKSGQFEYSNYGMGLLGHTLEIVTEKDLESLALEKLFIPLHMSNSSITLSPEMQNDMAQGYTEKNTKAKIWTFNALGGAGAFNSSASDLMKFIIANTDSKTIIYKSLLSMQKISENRVIGWMKPGFINKLFGNKSILWHNGMVGGYASYVAIDRETESGTVILSSAAKDVTALGLMLMMQIRTQSWK